MASPSLSERQSAPAFSFYPTDFLVGTATFSLLERGAYITLLCYQWDHGAVPSDALERARLLVCPQRQADTLWARIQEKFAQGEDGAWRNNRMEQERAKQAARRDALATSGAKGGHKRWHSEATSQAIAKPLPPPAIEGDGLSFSSSSSGVLSEKAQREPLALAEHTHQRRAGAFVDWYADTHSRLASVGYIGNPQKDFQAALQLVAMFTDAELKDAAIIWFGQVDKFATNGTRTVTKFASRASALVVQAREVAS